MAAFAAFIPISTEEAKEVDIVKDEMLECRVTPEDLREVRLQTEVGRREVEECECRELIRVEREGGADVPLRNPKAEVADGPSNGREGERCEAVGVVEDDGLGEDAGSGGLKLLVEVRKGTVAGIVAATADALLLLLDGLFIELFQSRGRGRDIDDRR